jgi:hypothetical protein
MHSVTNSHGSSPYLKSTRCSLARVALNSAPMTAGTQSSRQRLALVLTLLASFAVSVLVLLWQRRSEEAPPSNAPAPAAAVTSNLPPLRSGSAPPATPPPPASAPSEPEDSSAILALTVHNQRRFDKIEGHVRNDSERSLSVVLVGKDGAGSVTDSRILELKPGEQRSFGSDEGMELRAGGSVVARISGYADREIVIP